MKLALISDIHANLPALEAVLGAIDGDSAIAATYHLGDLVGYAPWPNETVALIRSRGIAGVAGNYDSTVGSRYKHCGCRYEDPLQEQLSHLSFEWTLRHASQSSASYLARLPFRMDVRPLGGHGPGPSLVLVHGTPTLNTVYWTEDRSDDFCLKMTTLAGMKRGDVIAFGHTHKPWYREIDGFHFVNTGSVGRPKDGDWRAGFILIDFDEERVAVHHERVEYDIARACDGIRKSDLPDDFAEYLRSAGRSMVSGG